MEDLLYMGIAGIFGLVLIYFPFIPELVDFFKEKNMFNRWKPYPQNKPKERGWYICSIRYGEEKEQAYVMDLFWDDKRKLWKDNRRLDVYNMYDVFGYNDETGMQDKKMYHDNLCIRNDVIAFKKLPKIYK